MRLPKPLSYGLRFLWVSAALLLGLEGAFRLALFGPPGLPVIARLRNPAHYFHGADWRYWALRSTSNGGQELGPAQNSDPLLGWTSGRFVGEERQHLDEPVPPGERPIIIVGDSFAACEGAPERSYARILEEGPFGPTHQILNYAVGGYGTDQVLLLAFELIERFKDEQPIFILGILVEDDLDRCTLPYRGAPKPMLEARSDREVAVLRYPEPLSRAEWLAQNPLGVRWWSKRYFAFNHWMTGEERVADGGGAAALEQMRVTIAAGMRQYQDALLAAGLEGFVLLFHDMGAQQGSLERAERLAWLEAMLGGQRIPWVRAWTEIDDHMAAHGAQVEDYFVTEGIGKGHYNALGNELSMLAIERGLRGALDGPSMVLHDSLAMGRTGEGAIARWERYAYAAFGPADLPHVLLRAGTGEGGQASVTFEPERPPRRLRAFIEPYLSEPGATEVVVLCPEGELWRERIAAGDERRAIAIDLPEAGRFEIRVESLKGEEPLPILFIQPALDHHESGPMLVHPPK